MYVVYWLKHIHHTDPLSQGYIGLTNNFKARKKAHNYNQDNLIVRRALRKGAVFEILEQYETLDEAKICELFFRPREKIGWNIAQGGAVPPSHKGKSPGEYNRLRSSETHKGRPKSAEQRIKISLAHQGRPRTESQKQAASKTHKGKTISIEHRSKISAFHKGRSKSTEQRQKMSQARKFTPRITCKWCNREFTVQNHTRFHGERCKMATPPRT